MFYLADDGSPDRDAVASTLLEQDRSVELVPAKPVLHKVTEERYWPDDGVMPSLARFVGPKSWLIFKALNLSDAELDWLKFRSCEWEKFSGFKKFQHFVKHLAVVNDNGERGVKAVQEVIGRTRLEPHRQNLLLSIADERKSHPNRGKGNVTKEKLADI